MGMNNISDVGKMISALMSDEKDYDNIALTYVSGGAADGEISTVTYKDGLTTIYTLTLGYNSTTGKLESVTRS